MEKLCLQKFLLEMFFPFLTFLRAKRATPEGLASFHNENVPNCREIGSWIFCQKSRKMGILNFLLKIEKMEFWIICKKREIGTLNLIFRSQNLLR